MNLLVKKNLTNKSQRNYFTNNEKVRKKIEYLLFLSNKKVKKSICKSIQLRELNRINLMHHSINLLNDVIDTWF
jgi:c-di-GMP-binding flagellar brake protein YcgR